MKPTYGLVSLHGVIPLAPSLDHVGPITRTVRDNAIMLGAMAGFDPQDRASARSEVKDYAHLIGRSVRGLRVGVPRRFIFARISSTRWRRPTNAPARGAIVTPRCKGGM